MTHESELDHVKRQIFSELDTMTTDQHRELLKAFVNELIDLTVQSTTLADVCNKISKQLDAAVGLPSLKQLKRAVRQSISESSVALANYSAASIHSAALLKQRLLSIDPNIIHFEMTKQ